VYQDDLDIELKRRPHDDERRAKLDLDKADADHQRRKDFLLFVSVVVLIAVVALSCLAVMVFSLGSPDTQKSVSSLLTVIVSAAAGYMTGKGGKS
jgi:lipopolysaccharide export LptBFGC system permease protein LptF